MKKVGVLWMLFISLLIANEMDWRMYQHDNQRTGFTPYKGNFPHVMYKIWADTILSEAPPVLGDVDNDNEIEVVVSEYSWYIHGIAVRDGKTGELEWVCNLPELGGRDGRSVPVIEDINNDEIKEIIYSHSGFYGQYPYWYGEGRIYVLNKLIQDTIWCFKSDTLFFTGVAVSDVDGDGLKEVIFGAGKVKEACDYIPSIFILNGEDGSIYWIIDSVFVAQRDKNFQSAIGEAYPIPFGAYPYLADLNNDGVEDIIGVKLHSDSTWHLCGIDAKNKNILWETSFSFFGASIQDLDNDGINEIVTSFMKRYQNIRKDSIFLRCFEGNSGNLKWEYKTKDTIEEYSERFSYQPAIADINKDGYKEIILVIDSYVRYYTFLNIFNKDGNILHKDSLEKGLWNFWNLYECGESHYAPVIVDIDNDDTIEVLYWSNGWVFTLTHINCINGVNFQKEWEEIIPDFNVITTQFADVDNDSILEIVFLAHGCADTGSIIAPFGVIYVFNECANLKEMKILIKKINNKNFIYNISGQKFLKENLRNLPPGIYFSPYEKKKYFKIFKRR